ncbi:hypothetical protein HGP16_25260 [Rhizobium sp. P40RR-XXII]|uniref:hypothetical protein n=1 Tax=Rhizobium sp. P40RR-XXII TaxID=2726739 RepID=UPI0014573B55|nr:hypothetical protein [Rhizobium sp. P40RR-XXII]NLS19851.1 hypothetical protein [Rhizobium sp. P40RR-XXII]
MSKLEELIAELETGHWEASVYHCPPPRSRRDNQLKHSSIIRLRQNFPTEEAALECAAKSIALGWAGTTIVHRESAKPLASFVLSRSAVDAVGRYLPTLRAKLAQEEA